jgi:hypothetical protein
MPFNYLETGDVNGDGFQDLVAGYTQNTNCMPSASTPSGFFVVIGDGAGRFDAKFTPFRHGIFFVRLADLNSDRKTDLIATDLVAGRGFTLSVIAGNGDGTFDTRTARSPLGGQYLSNILAVDYNGDDKTDLVLPTAGVAGSDGSPEDGTEGVLLLPGLGDFTFGQATRVLEGVRMLWNGADAADFNGDDRLDLAFATYAKPEPYTPNFGVTILPNNGNGAFGPAVSELVPLGVTGSNSVLFVDDLNSDKAPDIVAGSGLASPLLLNAESAGEQ